MRPIGTYIQPDNPNIGLATKDNYYAIRYNEKCGFMSDQSLGLQVLIKFLGSYQWINIKQEWLGE